jgi:hypothetical protein
MPAKVNEYWIGQVKQMKAEHPQWGAPRIAGELSRLAASVAADVTRARNAGEPVPRELALRGDPPSERWVSQFLRLEWPNIPDNERRQYTLAKWPDSFTSGALPWEASATTLELLRERQRRAELRPDDSRPLVRVAKWFHRVSLAAPDLEFELREVLAFISAAHESKMLADPEIAEIVEAWLMYGRQPDLYKDLPDLSKAKVWLRSGLDHDLGEYEQ